MRLLSDSSTAKALVENSSGAHAFPMAEVVMTAEERERIAEILDELAGTFEDFASDIREELSSDDWALVLEYTTVRLRTVLEVATSLIGVCETNEHLSWSYPGRGREAFVRAGLKAWGDCYATIRAPWRLAPVFARVPGGEMRLVADVTTLETMALNRLYDTIELQHERLLATEG